MHLECFNDRMGGLMPSK